MVCKKKRERERESALCVRKRLRMNKRVRESVDGFEFNGEHSECR